MKIRLFLFIFMLTACFAKAHVWSGSWSGILRVSSIQLTLVFHLAEEGGE